MRLSEDEFDELVDEALASVPETFRPYLQNVIVEVQGRPDARTRRSMGVRRGTLLLGMYRGVPLTEKRVDAPYEMPGRIVLFKDPIEAVCRTRRQVVRQVRKTVLHEVGHHFGLDERQLDELGYG